MTYYTIIPEEWLSNDQPNMDYHYVYNKNGVPFVGERLPDGSIRVQRIISTEPNDYLSTSLSPGNIIYNL
ncbi:YlzJ-like family protein [Pradoshia sp.]